MKKSVLVAMSGGVDSSVSATLLQKEGYDVKGVTLRLWEEGVNQSVIDAKKICDKLNIEHYALDEKERFYKYVVSNFVEEYESAITPNPCVKCNKYLKFAVLFRTAEELNCDFVATGHYAKVVRNENGARLSKAGNKKKDQSYVLYNLTKDMIEKIIFPLGDAKDKSEVRALAKTFGLPVAEKPDSQDICFITDNDTKRFLLSQNSSLKNPGNIVFAPTGEIIGKHEGLAFYTIGQRKGLGITWKEPLYVTSMDAAKNEIAVNVNESLFTNRLIATNINFTETKIKQGETLLVKAKIRYAHKEAEAKIHMLTDDTCEVIFEDKQRAITPGQSVVFYEDDFVLGGGIIIKE